MLGTQREGTCFGIVPLATTCKMTWMGKVWWAERGLWHSSKRLWHQPRGCGGWGWTERYQERILAGLGDWSDIRVRGTEELRRVLRCRAKWMEVVLLRGKFEVDKESVPAGIRAPQVVYARWSVCRGAYSPSPGSLARVRPRQSLKAEWTLLSEHYGRNVPLELEFPRRWPGFFDFLWLAC